MDLTLLTLQECATVLRCSVHFVRTLVNSDELKLVPTGKRYLVARCDLNRWIEANRKLRSQIDEELGESLGQAHVKRVASM